VTVAPAVPFFGPARVGAAIAMVRRGRLAGIIALAARPVRPGAATH